MVFRVFLGMHRSITAQICWFPTGRAGAGIYDTLFPEMPIAYVLYDLFYCPQSIYLLPSWCSCVYSDMLWCGNGNFQFSHLTKSAYILLVVVSLLLLLVVVVSLSDVTIVTSI